MSAGGAAPAVLDWRALVDEPEIHDCGCERCPDNGRPDSPAWFPLVRTTVDLTPHVSDRWLLLNARRAPIPEQYEGQVSEVPQLHAPYLRLPVLDAPATGHRFEPRTLKALELTGWRLRLLDYTAWEAGLRQPRRFAAVVTPAGEHIGWTVSLLHHATGPTYEEPQ